MQIAQAAKKSPKASAKRKASVLKSSQDLSQGERRTAKYRRGRPQDNGGTKHDRVAVPGGATA